MKSANSNTHYTSTGLHQHPFGMLMQERSYSSSAYKFGFNGKEKDNEINVDGGDYDYGARIYDCRLGRWLSLDPLKQKYPGISPYNFCANNSIIFHDIGGADFRYTLTYAGAMPIITLESTIHLYGPDASSVNTDPYTNNKFVLMNLYNPTSGKYEETQVHIVVSIKYVNDVTKEKAEEAIKSNPGDNMMLIDTKLDGCEIKEFGENESNRGNPLPEYIGGLAQGEGASRANSKETARSTIDHEALHLMGIRDRYQEKDGHDLRPICDNIYDNTVMSACLPGINLHYNTFYDIAKYVLTETKGKATEQKVKGFKGLQVVPIVREGVDIPEIKPNVVKIDIKMDKINTIERPKL